MFWMYQQVEELFTSSTVLCCKDASEIANQQLHNNYI